MDTVKAIQRINTHLNERFPDGNTPHHILGRLLEEAGEIAAAVHHLEGQGVKRAKHGEPTKAALAKELQDVLRCVYQLVDYYNCQYELNESIHSSLAKISTS